MEKRKALKQKERKNGLDITDKIKKRLYPAVLELFSRKDFYQVNLRAISKNSGVSTGTIYKYFSSKEDLLFTIIEENIQEIEKTQVTQIQGLESAEEIFRKLLWVTLDYYDKNPEVAITAFITLPMRTWMKQEGYKSKYGRSIFEEIIKKGLKRGDIDPQINSRLYQDIYYMICYRYIHMWYYFGMKWKLVDAVYKDFDKLWKFFLPPE
ncbi:MAG: TetR/AcrR family transcriptional regulator [Deltaproteobacteria bacterium]|nr:TetR/AcrR family transcriptional regulator [Deltaproteobacteria bacterium]MBW2142359.1 TetR/AcrR family transcriptional regulator [Deltaproteobacteria bacterium]MBW2324838.1 TetR/AcrR family transcriptional regulator [Deltaproteobacteria bacterium]